MLLIKYCYNILHDATKSLVIQNKLISFVKKTLTKTKRRIKIIGLRQENSLLTDLFNIVFKKYIKKT